MTAENWVEIMDRAQQLAPDVPREMWREVELAMRGWSVAQEPAGYRAEVDHVVAYARALAALSAEHARVDTPPEPEALPESA